jgi:hypothetical protein
MAIFHAEFYARRNNPRGLLDAAEIQPSCTKCMNDLASTIDLRPRSKRRTVTATPDGRAIQVILYLKLSLVENNFYRISDYHTDR